MAPNKFHGKDLRSNRTSLSEHIYHLTFVTANRDNLFKDFGLASVMCRQLNDISSDLAKTLAFVVMPDHVHWLMQLGSAKNLPECMQQVKGASSRVINQHLRISDKVWQAGYYDHMLRDDEDLRATARYIVANRIRAGLVKRVGDYPFWNAIWL